MSDVKTEYPMQAPAGDYPPSYPAQQGYPEPQQGYPAQQGYPPQQGYLPQQPATNVVIRQGQVQPNDYLAFAIIVTICCCLPLGIVAIIKSTELLSSVTMLPVAVWNSDVGAPILRLKCVNGTKLLTDKLLTEISGKLGQEWKALGRILGLTKEDIYQIQDDNKLSVREQMFEMLARWNRDCRKSERDKVSVLCVALDDDPVDQGMLADEIKEKFHIELI